MADSLKFYTDKHIPKQVAIQLRQRGVDVVRCEEVGMGEADDQAQLEYAIQHERAMISIDTDFQGLHARWLREGRSHTGVFCISKHLQGEGAIGTMVKELWDYHQLVELGAATLKDDIFDHVF
jgi:hypothetical protein